MPANSPYNKTPLSLGERRSTLSHILTQHAGVSEPRMPHLKQSMLSPEEKSLQQLNKHVNLLAGHMTHQSSLHDKAMCNTRTLFEELLDELPLLCETFKGAFTSRDVETQRIFSEIDPDRSIGVLNVIWHCLSFTSRGNTKPLALNRPGKDPVFTGRILAIRGDFQDLSHSYDTSEFSDLLPFELASLYVPADPLEPAIIRVPHLGDSEEYINQASAARVFLMKTIEMVCSGGFLHEQ